MRNLEVVAAPVVRLTTTYSAGSALSQGLSIWARNLLLYFGLSFLAHLPAGFFVPGPRISLARWGLWLLSFVVAGILGLIVKGLVTYSVLEQLRGRKPPVAEALAKSWSRTGLLLVVALSTGLLLFAAGLLFVVPAIIFSVQWALLSPVVMAEGDVDARGRSEQLTAGHRWSIFGVMVLFWFVSSGLGGLARRLFGVSVLTLTVPGALTLSLSAVVYSVMYYQLRSEKEGVDIEQLTSVFR